MLKSREKYNSKDGKRLVLVVDDEKVNRDLLGLIVSRDFDVLYAENGKDALEIIREKKDLLSLVLLDILMPVMDGYEVLKTMKTEPEIAHVPVIVLTSAQSMEVECLKMGAFDFIVKPFNAAEVILARIQKTIELSEDRFILNVTERDAFTHLLNKEFFFNYAYKYDTFHENIRMDAVTFNVNNFHLINEIYGRDKGDEILSQIASFLKELVDKTGCMATRLESDKFLCYMPYRDYDYNAMFMPINKLFEDMHDVNARVRIGIYRNVDKNIPIENRFDRAMRASNLKKDDYTAVISYYEEADYKRDIYLERLTNDMNVALEKGQFEVYFQPKYSVEKEPFTIASAEALVRWSHPDLGLISPNSFIPLFEKNGMIKDLDRYVWSKCIQHMHEWKEKYGYTIPISVNISRVDVFDSEVEKELINMLDEYNVPHNKLYLEITESAYVDAINELSDAIVNIRKEGFIVEMDDFGAGYSSLNMLSDFLFDHRMYFLASYLRNKFIYIFFSFHTFLLSTYEFLYLFSYNVIYLSLPPKGEGVSKSKIC